MLHLEITEVVLIHCDIVNNDYQQDSRVLYTFVPNEPFGSLLEISPTNHIFLKTFNSEYETMKLLGSTEKKTKDKYGESRFDREYKNGLTCFLCGEYSLE